MFSGNIYRGSYGPSGSRSTSAALRGKPGGAKQDGGISYWSMPDVQPYDIHSVNDT